MNHFSSAMVLCALLATAGTSSAPAVAEEEGPDVRGDWFAEVNPTSKDMFVSDCACESYTQQIELTCKPKSGMVRVDLNDFITTQAKAGDLAPVTFDIDGAKVIRAATMAAFSGEEMRPSFTAKLEDPLFAAIAKGKVLTMTSGGKSAVSQLKGSKKAIAKMTAYCAAK